MYFGTSRLQNLESSQFDQLKKTLSTGARTLELTSPTKLELNNFGLSGTWKFSAEKSTCESTACEIHLPFSAAKLHMVASSPKAATVNVTVDGTAQAPMSVQQSMLYTLFDSTSDQKHAIVITVPSGFEAFTLTFG